MRFANLKCPNCLQQVLVRQNVGRQSLFPKRVGSGTILLQQAFPGEFVIDFAACALKRFRLLPCQVSRRLRALRLLPIPNRGSGPRAKYAV